jgi:hypothetical protein
MEDVAKRLGKRNAKASNRYERFEKTVEETRIYDKYIYAACFSTKSKSNADAVISTLEEFNIVTLIVPKRKITT